MSEPVLHQDFLDLLSNLLKRQVQFLVVGAHALAVHGVPRATGDLDILVRPVPPRRIDLLTAISGVTWDEAERSAVTVAVDGLSLPVLGREQLLANKLAAGRPKDIADASQLLSDQGHGDDSD